MDFFLKLFKAFNSAQSPWQMSLALTLGMLMGLTPYSGIQTLLVIFIALILNIHIGLFLVSAGFFAGFAYLLDPYFELLGFAVLHEESLQSLFTQAYNSSLLRLTYFNNTIVMGSTLIALALLLPMFFILNKLVYIYRDKIATKLQKFGLFRQLGVEVAEKKDSFLRLWGIAVFILLIGGLALFSIFFLDKLAQSTLEEQLSKALEKDVSMRALDISFQEGKLSIQNLAISDTKETITQMGNIELDIDFNQLLFQRYHIENIAITQMQFHTAPQSPSKISTQRAETKEDEDKEEESEDYTLPSISLEDPQVLVDRMGLSSQKDYETAQADIDEINTKYTTSIEKDFSQASFTQMSDETEALYARAQKVDVKTAAGLSKDINALKAKLNNKKTALSKLKSEFNSDKEKLQKHYSTLKNGADADYKKLRDQYSFDSQGGVNVIGVLFGDKIKGYLSSALEYYEIAKPYLSSDDEEEEVTPDRHKGRWIHYKELTPALSVWIKHVDMSGVIQDQSFSALIEDISSDQKRLHKAMRFEFNSSGKKVKDLEIEGTNSHLVSPTLSQANFSAKEAQIKDVDLSFIRLNSAQYSFQGEIAIKDYSALSASSTVLFKKSDLALKSSKGDLMQNIEKVIKKIDTFDLKIKLTGSLVKPNVSVRSNLDKKLSSAMKNVLKSQVDAYKKELKVLIEKEAKERLKALGLKDSELDDVTKILESKSAANDAINQRINQIEKELKTKANQEIEKQKKRAQAEVDKQKKIAKEKADKEKKRAEEKAKKEAKKALKSFGL